ncbi:RNA splicing factor [Lithospermum erythrorhizon]|uniref:RNA splicing factor n=1 Tax=Lithospermum erythrorhizon TaxID=34254 RepID=A0AAV3R1K9_LITER
MEVDNHGNELHTQTQPMDVEIFSAPKGQQAKCGKHDVDLGETLHEMIAEDSLDFGSWTFLISEIEKVHSDNIDMLSLAYDSFLSKFLLCHWYWTKYAYHKARLCTVVEAVDIFERAVESTTFSVGFWLNYCTFSESFLMDPSDIRRVYERAFSFVGKDYNCHVLWDKYLQFEFSQQQWGMLAHIYIRVLKFPTKGLHFYCDKYDMLLMVIRFCNFI